MAEPSRPKRLRCAIYTRKSSEEGLEQDFNSLHAQREACEAYIRSQKHEGWTLIPTAYDDGGFSGGTMERPALQDLLAAIRKRAVDIVVVYKVDRLTRALMDFAKIVEVFDAQGVSFVSVTQAFNTTTSMGRLTLNVLLSFAQFEREVTGERIRDKIAASKKKGLWMGGPVPLGYAVRERKLVVVEPEAELARHVFRRYAALGSVRLLKAELDQAGTRSPRRTLLSGRSVGGCRFSRGKLYALLQNSILIGQIHHKGMTYPGEHAAIIDQALWDQVQVILAGNRQDRHHGKNAAHPSLLAGLLFDEDGARLTPSHAVKDGKRYRYYISQGLLTKETDASAGWRLPAQALESAVITALCRFLTERQRLLDAVSDTGDETIEIKAFFHAARSTADVLQTGRSEEKRACLLHVVQRITVSKESLSIVLQGATLARLAGPTGYVAPDESEPIMLDCPMIACRRGVETKLVIADHREEARSHDPVLIQTIAKAFVWLEILQQDPTLSLRSLAGRERIDVSVLSRTLPSAFLAPDIIEAILDGRQPPMLTAKALTRMNELPLDWPTQQRTLDALTN